MTRRDYILIMAALRAQFHRYMQTDGETIVLAVAAELATALARDNRRFDSFHFMAVIRGERDLNSQPENLPEVQS